jgi:hypothetical protein
MLSIDLPAFFWKPLVGAPLTIDDLKDIDHSLYTGVLKFMKKCSREDLEGEFLSLSLLLLLLLLLCLHYESN